MKNILYLGHSFHQKTKSTQFFIDILEKNYNVDFFWTLPRVASMEIKNSYIWQKDYDCIVMFQILLDVNDLKQFKCQNITLIPMYDNELNKTYSQWSKYYEYKFINFSKSLYNKLKILGIRHNIYLQYAPNIVTDCQKKEYKTKVDIFFWQRSKSLNWELIKKLINKSQVNSVHIHRIEAKETNDLWFQKPKESDITEFNITFSSWFNDKDELIDKIKNCDIFIQPRYNEGIGQAFLEAMAYGKCIISPDLPTMNEYITHGVNGLLYNPKDLIPLDLSNHKIIGERARNTISQIKNIWDTKEEKIINFIETSTSKHKHDFSNIKKLETNLKNEELNFFLDDLKLISGVSSKSMIFSLQLNQLEKTLNSLKKENDTIILYGSGTGAKLILGFIPEIISYLVDIDDKKHGNKLFGKEIFPIKKLFENNNKILLSVFGRSIEVIQSLEEIGITPNRIICLDLS